MDNNRNFIDYWFSSFFDLGEAMAENISPDPISVRGSVDYHLGPTSHKASAEFIISPIPKGISFSSNLEISRTQNEFIEYGTSAAYGFLDVVLTRLICPLAGFDICLENIFVDSSYSNVGAFRMAGRDAGQRYLDIYLNRIGKR